MLTSFINNGLNAVNDCSKVGVEVILFEITVMNAEDFTTYTYVQN